MSERRAAYPEIEPYRSGRLAVGDGHVLHFEECGNPRRQAGGDPPRRAGRRLQHLHAPVA